MRLEDEISTIPKITKPQVAALKKLELFTIRDLLFHLPYRYLDFSKTSSIKELVLGENLSLKVTIKSIGARFSFRSRMSMAEALVSDNTGTIKVVWFNQGYLAKTLSVGDEVFLSGQVESYNNRLQMTNPIYEKVSDFPVHTARLVPIYHLTQSLYPKTLRNLVKLVLPALSELDETLPENIIRNQNLLNIKDAISFSHFPKTEKDVEKAKIRLDFEEIFLGQLAVQKQRIERAKKKCYKIPFDQTLVKNFVSSLPFTLTPEQKKAAWEVLQDLEKPVAMNRLLEGDVGSGKTLVAFIAALQAISQNFQVAILCPTEVLAKQHHETAVRFLGSQNFKICLLTNTYSKTGTDDLPKPKLHALLKEGMPGLYIGTHALIQEKVKFKKLALVIIDEQHRFGVRQRSDILSTGKNLPHLLSMSATPIPRTLKLALVGDLDISEIKHKPSNRKPITTKLVNQQKRAQAYEFIENQIFAGRQAFVITPLIEESDKVGAKAATQEAQNLEKIFPNLKIGLLHGKLKGKEKEAVMADFLAKKYHILVSTSVIEVGVDVPNASVIVIEGAERFGLAQLHQFRGRVGRSEHQSYCFLFASEKTSASSESGTSTNQQTKRLEAFAKTQSGFDLAELDLKLRGFGKLYGQEQSGMDFKYYDPNFIGLIPKARQESLQLLKSDPSLQNFPYLRTKVENQLIHLE